MPLTPADIHNMAFRKSPLGKRGYDEEEVDVLLDAASQEMIKLLEENNALRDRVPQGRATLPQAAPDGATEAELSAATGALERARQAFDQAEHRAQTLHDRLAEARRAAARERAPKPSGVNTDGVLALANRSADQHVESAHEDARKLSSEARSESERVTRQARRTAREITEESRRRDSEAVTALRDGRAALLLEIEQLTEFAESYRAALESHLHRQQSL